MNCVSPSLYDSYGFGISSHAGFLSSNCIGHDYGPVVESDGGCSIGPCRYMAFHVNGYTRTIDVPGFGGSLGQRADIHPMNVGDQVNRFCQFEPFLGKKGTTLTPLCRDHC